ncbi:MAG: CBS domain-containing protein [Gammaproteobacteria bacterium]|nr:CBS domain-containing protein [Gammaproteobacteria bacterium]
MKISDIMSTNVATVTPGVSIKEVATLMVQRRISGVPVVDEVGHVVGMISEGDLIRRPEMDTDKPVSRWASLMTGQEQKARDFVKTHGLHAKEVMTPTVMAIAPGATLNEAAARMEKNKIKRLPVVEHGKLIGIVTRADLLRALAATPEFKLDAPPASDRAIRDKLNDLLRKEDWAASAMVNVIVTDGTVQMWGVVDGEDQRKALRVAAEGIDGVKTVEDHLSMGIPT